MSEFLKMADTSCQGDWERNALQVSELDCKKLCQDEPRCKYIMINNENYCYLKGNNDASSNDNLTCNEKPGQTSYQNMSRLPELPGFLKMRNTNCYGDWEYNAGAKSELECLQLCKDEPRCKYFIRNQQNVCYLKGNKDASSTNNLTCKKALGQTSYQNLSRLSDLPQKVEGWSLRLQNTDVQPGEGAGQHYDISIAECVKQCQETDKCKSAVVHRNADTKDGPKNGTRSCYMRIGKDVPPGNPPSKLVWSPQCPSDWVSYVPQNDTDNSCRVTP